MYTAVIKTIAGELNIQDESLSKLRKEIHDEGYFPILKHIKNKNGTLLPMCRVQMPK